jgi:hypothetical protein
VPGWDLVGTHASNSGYAIKGAATLDNGVATGELRPDLDIDDALDILNGPLWLRLLVGHRSNGPTAADRLLDLAWPGLQAEPKRRPS